MFRYSVEVQTEGGWEVYRPNLTYMNAYKYVQTLTERGYQARITQEGKAL